MDVKIRFAEESLPTVKKGKAALSIHFVGQTEKETLGESKEEIELVFSRKRFTVAEHEVYSVYPPKESSGDYRYHLPHIVLNRATIPWEFSDDSSPSLALFLLRAEENAQYKEVEIKSIRETGSEIFASPALGMTAADADKPDGTCKVVDVPAKQFKALYLNKEQRRLLSHVREVSLDDKVTDPEIKDGKFSVVIAHRFPEEGLNRMFAVSLAEYDGVAIPDSCQFVRCICYAHWEFRSEGKTYDFFEEVKKLETGPLVRPVSQRVSAGELKDLLNRGFLPMNHNMREGSKTVSWYRGPWIPYDEETEKPAYRIFADELYCYDTQAGMLDISYASAWQLGRLVAMHYPTVAGELISWRLRDYRRAAVEEQKKEIMDALASDTADVQSLLKEMAGKAAQKAPDYEEEKDGA